MRLIKARTGHLQGASTSIMTRKTGSPTGRETQGDAAPIVRVGVPPDQGERESRPPGKGWQGKDDKPPGHAVRDARRQEGRCVQTREPDAGKLARPVRGREDGKVLFSNSPASYPGAGMPIALRPYVPLLIAGQW